MLVNSRQLFTLLVSGALTLSAWGEPNITNTSPGPGARIATKRPKIQAYFPDGIGSAQIWVDGREFTSASVVDKNWVVLNLPYDLDYGQHTVQLAGFGSMGDRTPAKWTFYIEKPEPLGPPVPVAGVTGTWRSGTGKKFQVSQHGTLLKVTLLSNKGKTVPGKAWWVQPGRVFDFIGSSGPQVNRATLDSTNSNHLQVQEGDGKTRTWVRVP